MPTAGALALAYQVWPVSSWAYDDPVHWRWSLNAIAQLSPNQKVLDVGCFRGDFLSELSEEYEKFGVEPNPQASQIAAKRGIKIIGRDAMDHLKGHEGEFGAIVMMDVAEHLPDPAAAFRHLRKFLAPQGILIVLTGNSDHWLSKLSLPFYWYMSYSIHLVYLGKRYFKWISKADGWELARDTSYAMWAQTASIRSWERKKGVAVLIWKKFLENTPLAPALRKLPAIDKVARLRIPPPLYSQPDHIGVVLRRTGS